MLEVKGKGLRWGKVKWCIPGWPVTKTLMAEEIAWSPSPTSPCAATTASAPTITLASSSFSSTLVSLPATKPISHQTPSPTVPVSAPLSVCLCLRVHQQHEQELSLPISAFIARAYRLGGWEGGCWWVYSLTHTHTDTQREGVLWSGSTYGRVSESVCGWPDCVEATLGSPSCKWHAPTKILGCAPMHKIPRGRCLSILPPSLPPSGLSL